MSRPRKNPLFITKICEECKKEFTISYRKNRQRFCSKSCAQHNSSVLRKMEESKQKTYNEKYNGLHPMQTEKTKNAFKKSISEKYNGKFYTDHLTKKTKQTKLEKYGDENYNNINQRKQTCKFKYGVDNYTKTTEFKERCKNSKYKNHYQFIINHCYKKNITLLFNEDDYLGYDFKNKYRFKCNKCNDEFETDIYKPNHIFCEKCNPLDKNTLENDIFNFISSILQKSDIIKRNDRTILFGKELDIYIPSKKIAIELNGLYWHSEYGNNITKYYHLNKSKNCIFHEIKLIQVFENEWIHKKPIVKSILTNILTKSINKIYARKCIVKELSNDQKNIFLNENHIQGSDLSSVKLGLYYNNELVSVMTFGSSRFDKKIQWEMVRYCNKLDCCIIGGASKLFSFFIKNYNPISIVSYSDRRYFEGKVYLNLGFKFIKNTSPNYYYISNNYKFLYSRMAFQKHKQSKILKNFNPSLSEWENMKNNGYDRIWDCGNSKWGWIKNSNYHHP